MVISLTPDLESALTAAARERGMPAEVLAVDVLRERFLGAVPAIQPRDEWERGLLAAAKACGVSLSNESLSSEGLYD